MWCPHMMTPGLKRSFLKDHLILFHECCTTIVELKRTTTCWHSLRLWLESERKTTFGFWNNSTFLLWKLEKEKVYKKLLRRFLRRKKLKILIWKHVSEWTGRQVQTELSVQQRVSLMEPQLLDWSQHRTADEQVRTLNPNPG